MGIIILSLKGGYSSEIKSIHKALGMILEIVNVQ